VGQSRKRIGTDGKPRYTAYYDDLRGRRRSAGTFSSKKLAEKAWQKAEADLAAGKIGDPRRGRQSFRRYVEEQWLPHHAIERSTLQAYTYLLDRYILPEFGPMRIVEILPSHVREWIVKLQRLGANPPTIVKCKVIIDAIFTTALNDQITFLHAGKGVKTPPVVAKPRKIVTPEQFDVLYQALSDEIMRLLVETDIESGLRWGELTEIRVKDIDLASGIVTVSRVVVELNPRFHPEGKRFLVKDYPKDQKVRSFRLSPDLVKKIKIHVEERALRPNNLLFELISTSSSRRRTPEILPDPATLGLTEPNKTGKQYRHGTTTAYTLGRCRCRYCKDAMADYRARRRASGKDSPRTARTVETDGHIGRDWFRHNVWTPALKAAELDFHLTPHGLRHAHASWLLAGGADLQVVKERLGHGSIRTTEKYLHTLADKADHTAISALRQVRGRSNAA
jgi:integrase